MTSVLAAFAYACGAEVTWRDEHLGRGGAPAGGGAGAGAVGDGGTSSGALSGGAAAAGGFEVGGADAGGSGPCASCGDVLAQEALPEETRGFVAIDPDSGAPICEGAPSCARFRALLFCACGPCADACPELCGDHAGAPSEACVACAVPSCSRELDACASDD